MPITLNCSSSSAGTTGFRKFTTASVRSRSTGVSLLVTSLDCSSILSSIFNSLTCAFAIVLSAISAVAAASTSSVALTTSDGALTTGISSNSKFSNDSKKASSSACDLTGVSRFPKTDPPPIKPVVSNLLSIRIASAQRLKV